MKILYVASEALPYASTGGLADVLGSLPIAVKRSLGDEGDVRVVIPMFPSVKEKFFDQLKFECETTVRLSWRSQYCGIWSTVREGVTYYFIDNEYYFKRPALYGSFDDGERFAFFGKAVLELMAAMQFFPDILHANDWQTAPAVIYLKRKFGLDPGYEKIRVLYTIHNIEYQGVYDFSILGDVFELAEWDRSIVEYNGAINLTKGALMCADRISTVSPRYAAEIMTEYYSAGLHHVLNACSHKLSGIINGIDTEYYNCAADPEIAAVFTKDDLSGKVKDKMDLQAICGFEPDPDVPLIVMISRLATHKGFDLIRHVIEEFLNRNYVQVALLGTGERDMEGFFADLGHRYPGKFCAKLEYNKALSKKFYAGADMFLMPSKSEPCGLAQMIASQYGTVPVVRETGGLFDTIHAYNQYTGEGNGFSFTNYNAHEMMHVLENAVALYHDKEKWNALVKNVMDVDFSWNASAEKYLQLYTGMCEQ